MPNNGEKETSGSSLTTDAVMSERKLRDTA
jgi:hypothetical protein